MQVKTHMMLYVVRCSEAIFGFAWIRRLTNLMGVTFARASDVMSGKIMPVPSDVARDIVFVSVEKKICGVYERR